MNIGDIGFIPSTVMPIIERQTDYTLIVILVVSFLSFITFLFVKIVFPGYYQTLWYSASRLETINKNHTESNSTSNLSRSIVIIGSTLSIASTLYAIYFYSPLFYNTRELKPLVVMIISVLSCVGFLGLSTLCLSFLGYLFDQKEITKSYSMRLVLIYKLSGLILLPLFLIMPFVDGKTANLLTISILGLIGFALLFRFINFFYYLFKIKFFNHYSILYFCTFEILPILILLKIVLKLRLV